MPKTKKRRLPSKPLSKDILFAQKLSHIEKKSYMNQTKLERLQKQKEVWKQQCQEEKNNETFIETTLFKKWLPQHKTICIVSTSIDTVPNLLAKQSNCHIETKVPNQWALDISVEFNECPRLTMDPRIDAIFFHLEGSTECVSLTDFMLLGLNNSTMSTLWEDHDQWSVTILSRNI